MGEVRIGVAVSDATGFLASPYITLRVARDESQTWRTITQLIAETESEGLVVGLPVSLDGQIHAQAAKVQAIAERLRQHITIPLVFWDERLSTVEAQRLLGEQFTDERDEGSGGSRRRSGNRSGQGQRRRRKGHEIDALAATVILQDYLDHYSEQRQDFRV